LKLEKTKKPSAAKKWTRVYASDWVVVQTGLKHETYDRPMHGRCGISESDTWNQTKLEETAIFGQCKSSQNKIHHDMQKEEKKGF